MYRKLKESDTKMNLETAWKIVELHKGYNWDRAVLLDSTHGRIAINQMHLLEAAYATLVREYCEKQ